MKITIIISVVTLLFVGSISSGYAKSREGKIPDYAAKAIYKQFNKSVSYPDFGYNKALSGRVDVLFTLSAEGNIVIKRITSENLELQNYVKELASKLAFNKLSYPIGQLYRITLSFFPG